MTSNQRTNETRLLLELPEEPSAYPSSRPVQHLLNP